jgi:hypothetical protein
MIPWRPLRFEPVQPKAGDDHVVGQVSLPYEEVVGSLGDPWQRELVAIIVIFIVKVVLVLAQKIQHVALDHGLWMIGAAYGA